MSYDSEEVADAAIAAMRREAAIEAADKMVASGELIRLTGGRIIEAELFNPVIHEPEEET